MRLLTVNTGSSSVRLALYAGDGGVLRLLADHHNDGETQPEHILHEFIGAEEVDVVAHRIVHGGAKARIFLLPERIAGTLD